MANDYGYECFTTLGNEQLRTDAAQTPANIYYAGTLTSSLYTANGVFNGYNVTNPIPNYDTRGTLLFCKFPTPTAGTADTWYLVGADSNGDYAMVCNGTANTITASSQKSYDYVFVKDYSAGTSDGSSYGIVLYADNGSVIFDSRRFNLGDQLKLTQIFSAGTLYTDGPNGYTSPARPPTDSLIYGGFDRYINCNHTWKRPIPLGGDGPVMIIANRYVPTISPYDVQYLSTGLWMSENFTYNTVEVMTAEAL